MSTTLILRQTRGADGEPWGENDYSAYEGELQVGRIYLSVSSTALKWYWTVNCYHPVMADDRGHVDSLEAAKAALKSRWLAIRERVLFSGEVEVHR
jgi:hypothetical protein